MGHAVKAPQRTEELNRQPNVLRGSSRYTGNLSAIKQTAKSDEAHPHQRARSRMSPTRHVSPYVLSRSVPLQQVQTNARMPGPDAANKRISATAQSSEAVSQQKKPTTSNSTWILSMVAALTGGCIAGSLLSMPTDSGTWTDLAIATGNSKPTTTADEPHTTAAGNSKLLEAAESTPVISSGAAEQPPTDQQLVIDQIIRYHIAEVDELLRTKTGLQMQVDSLSDETLRLNKELLELELEVATLEAQAAESTESRVVYNFIDVPIGTSKAGTTQPEVITVFEEDDAFTDQSDVATTEDYAQDERIVDEYIWPEEYDASGQMTYNNQSTALTVYDSQSFDQSSTEAEYTDADQIEHGPLNEDKVIYDEGNGFFLNPNYVPDTSGDSLPRQTYGPVVPNTNQ